MYVIVKTALAANQKGEDFSSHAFVLALNGEPSGLRLLSIWGDLICWIKCMSFVGPFHGSWRGAYWRKAVRRRLRERPGMLLHPVGS